MLNLIPHDGIANTLRDLFVVELRRVNSDDNQLVTVLFLQKLQVRQHVHAVDATIGPEVQDDNLSSQVLQIEWL